MRPALLQERTHAFGEAGARGQRHLAAAFVRQLRLQVIQRRLALQRAQFSRRVRRQRGQACGHAGDFGVERIVVDAGADQALLRGLLGAEAIAQQAQPGDPRR